MTTTAEAMREISALCGEAARAGVRDWREADALIKRRLTEMPVEESRAIRDVLRAVLDFAGPISDGDRAN